MQTYITIEMSTNSYKDLLLYIAEKKEMYLNVGKLSRQLLHLFKVAETVFKMLDEEDNDQPSAIN
eukprot:snap_masked-scaffold_11-processed-gene-0.4-mRNA-1 protein AED:1.00 eAED:1.00 QI:0/0/0/0/1/1/2/0/64